jgi:thiosulfate/3-mercaptopyruvate sulfurtransferase
MTSLPGPVVTVEWLSSHLNTPDLVIADVRWYLDGRSGRDAYDGGHLPGAVFVDLDHDLADPPRQPGGRHPLPSPQRFAAAMGALGIGDDVAVVAYDDSGGITAARLWWMLHVLDRPAAVLDGGLAAWTGPLSTEPTTPAPAVMTPRPWPAARVFDADAVAGAVSAGAVLLDARDPNRFAGQENAIDPRFGHIPGAQSAWCRDNLAADATLLDPADLAARFSALGALDADQVITYCGSGVSACHNLLALHVAGRDDAALYVGSWSEWGADPSRPLAT